MRRQILLGLQIGLSMSRLDKSGKPTIMSGRDCQVLMDTEILAHLFATAEFRVV